MVNLCKCAQIFVLVENKMYINSSIVHLGKVNWNVKTDDNLIAN